MRQIITQNKWFLLPTLALTIIGAITLTQIQTGDILLFLNQNRSKPLTLLFSYLTKLGEEIPYILVFVLLLYRSNLKKALIIPLIGLLATLLSYLLKTYFAHPRPYLFFKQKGILDQLNIPDYIKIHTANNSFPSGHTLSAFALYATISFLYPRHPKTSILLFLLATTVAISRIILFQHFFKDVYFGAILGTLLAIITHTLYHKKRKIA